MKKSFSFFLFIFFVFNICSEEIEFQELLHFEPYNIEEINSQNCIVEIFTDVQKVEVYLNGVYQGKSNLQIKNLVQGEYLIELKKDNYQIIKGFIFVSKNYQNSYFFELKEK